MYPHSRWMMQASARALSVGIAAFWLICLAGALTSSNVNGYVWLVVTALGSATAALLAAWRWPIRAGHFALASSFILLVILLIVTLFYAPAPTVSSLVLAVLIPQPILLNVALFHLVNRHQYIAR